MNRINLIGNVGTDPKTLKFGNNKALSFTMATKEIWQDKTSKTFKSSAEWHTILISNPYLAEKYESVLKKGMKVFIEGKLEYREFTNKDGEVKKATQINVQQFKGELIILSEHASTKSQASEETQPDKYDDLDNFELPAQKTEANIILSDEIPF